MPDRIITIQNVQFEEPVIVPSNFSGSKPVDWAVSLGEGSAPQITPEPFVPVSDDNLFPAGVIDFSLVIDFSKNVNFSV